MSEMTLLNLVGIFGLVIFVLGIWLFRSGKTIEQEIPHADSNVWLKPTPPMNRKSSLFYNWQAHFELWFLQVWRANSTKPLAYLCIATGVIFMIISFINILGLPVTG